MGTTPPFSTACTMTNMLELLSPSLILSALVALTAGLVGAFALMRRMTLAADPVSHIALPGIGIALLVGANPLLGGSIALVLGAFLIWILEERSRTNIDAVIGVVFAAALALGTIITPKEELIEALFGSLQELSPPEFWTAIAVSIGIVAFIVFFRHQMAVSLISRDLARASGVNTRLLNLVFLLVFVASIILGLRFIGALLMGSLIIIPAVSARKLAHGFVPFLCWSGGIAVFSMLFGTALAARFGWELGPSVIAAASAVFLATSFTPYRK
ncbi:MAG: metal ABC transporter permease [bacterium]|nr:metal ABC transporter permease [bacterium]